MEKKIFEHFIKGNELVNNGNKIVVSVGDVLHNEMNRDIMPFIINDDLCTVPKKEYRCKDYIFAVLMEDITIETAKKVDKRIKEDKRRMFGLFRNDIYRH